MIKRMMRMWPFARPYVPLLVASLATSTLASLLDGFSFALLIPFLRALFGETAMVSEGATAVEKLVSGTVGRYLTQTDPTEVLTAAVVLIFLAVVIKNLLTYVSALVVAVVQGKLGRDLRSALYAHLMTMRLTYIESNKSGQLLTRMLSDTEQARTVVNQTLSSLVRNTVVIIVYLSVLFSLSWRLSLVTLVLAPTLTALLRPITRRFRQHIKIALEDRGEMSAIMVEVVSGARVVKAYSGEEYERTRFTAAAHRYYHRLLRAQRFSILASPLSESMGAGVIVLLLLVAGWLARTGNPVRPELFIAFLAVTLRVLPPIKSLSQFPVWIETALSAGDRIFQVLDRASDDLDKPGAIDFPGLHEGIEFRNVYFAYRDEDWVLRDFSLAIPMGKVVGIVGHSGAGKSTIADLIPRFIEPQRGEIFIDGVPTSSFKMKSLRQTIGFVSQETVIFNDTVVTNIAYGDTNPDLEQVMVAARAANAHDFIEKLPDGYRTQLGERGTRLSGGERQRLALARAIYRDSPILILDEATSSLDTESERLVQEAIDRLFLNRTVVVIAHRLSTIVKADQIVVMDGGMIVEKGRHAELMELRGVYHQLYSLGLDTGVV